MNALALLPLLLQSLSSALPLAAKLAQNIKDGKGQQEVDQATVDEVARLCGLTGEDIYRRLGVATPPPDA